MTYTETLMAKGRPYIEAQLQKPFLIGIMNGDLPLDKFQYWLKVDYLYLIQYAKILALGVSKAESPVAMQVMERQLDGIVNKEMSLHEAYAAKFGITREQLIQQRMGPIKYSYTCHELAAAHSGSLGELLAALLPCMWGYGEIGWSLVEQKPIDPENPYGDWLALYSSEDFRQMGKEGWELLDSLAAASSESQLKKMGENFMTSFKYEVMCWDAYYNKEEWKTY